MGFQSQLKATGGQPGFPETIIKKHLVPTKQSYLEFLPSVDGCSCYFGARISMTSISILFSFDLPWASLTSVFVGLESVSCFQYC